MIVAEDYEPFNPESTTTETLRTKVSDGHQYKKELRDATFFIMENDDTAFQEINESNNNAKGVLQTFLIHAEQVLATRDQKDDHQNSGNNTGVSSLDEISKKALDTKAKHVTNCMNGIKVDIDSLCEGIRTLGTDVMDVKTDAEL